MGENENFYEFEQVDLEITDFDSEGFILDIGGGGEGVIGRLKGRDVVAIDIRKEELEEAIEGPLKIVMDARALKFLDKSFNTVTAFFSLMYIDSQADQQNVLDEIARVLRPGGRLHIWEVDLSERPPTDKEFYIVRLRYQIGSEDFGTGYSRRWPKESRNEKYYIKLAEATGFRHISTERNRNTFYLVFQKA